MKRTIAPTSPESLWNRITPQELAAEDVVLLPRALLRDGQIDELIAWLRKNAEKANTEANALEAFGKARAAIRSASDFRSHGDA